MTSWTYPAKVRRVIDADTIVCDLDMGMRVWQHDIRVRVLGVDAPEMNTPAGEAARLYVIDLMTSARWECTVVSESYDSFGRVLGDVYFDYGDLTRTKLLSNLLLADGHARPMSGKRS